MKIPERWLHPFFVIVLWAKAVFAAAEIVGGVAAWVVSKEFLLRLAVVLTHEELLEDPPDFAANSLLHAAQHLSIEAKTFASIYLLSHGVIKLGLVIGLLREKLWYYPAAIIVFFGFVAYQTYRYALHHAILLLAITVLDIVIIVLTWHEWRYLRGHVGRRSV